MRRVDEVSDWLSVAAVSTSSPNTLNSQAEALTLWWRWCIESGVDPLRTDAVRFARFVSALQNIPMGLPLTSPARADTSIVGDLHRDIAELRVQLMTERDTTRSLQATTATTTEDLTAAHEIARSYLRELNQSRDKLRDAHQELAKLRTNSGRRAHSGSP